MSTQQLNDSCLRKHAALETTYVEAHRPDSLKWKCCFYAVLCIAGTIFSANTIYGGTTRDLCFFSIQLQSSPFREQYMAALAGDTGPMPTAADSSEQSDVPYTFKILFRKARSNDMPGDALIDTFSRDCLTCHDSSLAVNVDFNYRNSPGRAIQLRPIDCKDHPNGMDYSSYEALGKGQFKYISPLNSNMKLVNGRVGCLTCHNPLNPEKGHLVMSDFRSALCQTCHNL